MSRPSEGQWACALARETAKRSTCLRRHVGAVLLDRLGHVIATGYNGAPVNEDHCTTCLREELGVPQGTMYEICRSVHAEANAVIQARPWASDGTLYLATIDPKTGEVVENWPCSMCARLLVNAGVREVSMLRPDGSIATDTPHTFLGVVRRGE
ncbi:MAG: cytidine deaminase [Methanospirillum sp.]|nr:cytidine deaminase [Methanospirillum sp.]